MQKLPCKRGRLFLLVLISILVVFLLLFLSFKVLREEMCNSRSLADPGKTPSLTSKSCHNSACSETEMSSFWALLSSGVSRYARKKNPFSSGFASMGGGCVSQLASGLNPWVDMHTSLNKSWRMISTGRYHTVQENPNPDPVSM